MSDRRLLLLLLCAYGWLFVYFDRVNNPNELVRVYAARALVEDHTWSFGRRVRVGAGFADVGAIPQSWGYINDKALVCDDPGARPPACAGKLYAAKAPGATALAAPVYAALRLFFANPSRTKCVFALRWLLVIGPTVAFWIALRRALRETEPGPVVDAAVLAGALGSLSLTYGQMFAGHQLCALALGAAWLCAFRRDRPALFGFFAAAAVAIEYPAAPAALILGIGWLVERRGRGLGAALLGAALPAALLMECHWSCFGAPWSTPYSHLENPEFVKDLAPGLMGISLPTWERVSGSLFAPWLGLFYWAPWVALAFLVIPRGTPARTAFAICVYYLLFQITHALWRSGWVVGPRYITPLVPFAVIVIAHAWRRHDWVLRGAGAAAIAATGLASAVCQGFPFEVMHPLREVVWPLLSHGFVPRNPLQALGVPGVFSALPCFAALALAIAALLQRRAAAWALCAALIAAQWLAPRSPETSGVHFLESTWEPNPPPGARPF